MTPAVKIYEGFVSPETQTVEIKADGSLVVNYYYVRNSYSVVLNKGTGIETVSGAGNYLYGEEVTISATIAYGYQWSGWTGTHEVSDQEYTFTMPAISVTDTANAVEIDLQGPVILVETPESNSSDAPTETNASLYTVSGRVYDRLSGVKSVTVNGEDVSVTDDAWSTTVTLTKDVIFKVTVVAIDNDGNSTTEENFVLYTSDIEGPIISVWAPTSEEVDNPTETEESVYTVSGVALDEVSGVKSLTINGSEVAVDNDGKFSTELTLAANQTTEITVVATDNEGNSSTEIRYVHYVKKTAFAIYSADDSSLRFYKRVEVPNVEEVYENLTVTAIWTGIEENVEAEWTSSTYRTKIKTVIVEDEISPVSTAGWFKILVCTYFDLTNLNTENVINMSGMFNTAGDLCMDDNPEIIGLSNFNTANVTDMSNMFAGSAFASLDLSSFDTTNVTNMVNMLYALDNLTEITLGEKFAWVGTNAYPTGRIWYDVETGIGYAATDIPSNHYATYSSDASATGAPKVTVINPDGMTISNATVVDVSAFVVSGTVSDTNGLDGVTVTINDVEATINSDGTWESSINLEKDVTTKLTIVATNSSGKSVTLTRYVVYKDPVTFAIYSGTDNSLRFYNNPEYWDLNVGDTYNGLKISSIYTGFDKARYLRSEDTPWKSLFSGVRKIIAEEEISPISMDYWFHNFDFCSYFDLAKINTENTTSMKYTFSKVFSTWYGKDETISILGLNNWNVENVETMSHMFYSTGLLCNNIIFDDISGWNTENVVDMTTMFQSFGLFDSSFKLDLSGWNVSKVTSYDSFNNAVKDKIIAPSFGTSTASLSLDDVIYIEPEEANITATVNKDSDGNVTGVYMVVEEETGIDSITVLNSLGDVVKEIVLSGETTYTSLLDITESGTYIVELLTSAGETKQITFEI